MMNYLTAGESHGPQLTGIIEGIPSGLHLDVGAINDQLKKRQGGYGRGNRQKIEHDEVTITGGVRHGITLGSPIALVVNNRDHAHWSQIMDPISPETPENTLRKVERPRPGHADLVGGMKYRHEDLRNVLERSSARETAIRVAIGAVCKQLLQQLGINIVGYVEQIGQISTDENPELNVAKIEAEISQNDLRIIDQSKVSPIHDLIDQTKRDGDTLGGIIRVVATNVPAGLGSYISWDTKLDGKLAAAVMGVNAMKGVEIGDGFKAATSFGSQVMDEIDWNQDQGFFRNTDHLGGFEGGMTNGMPIIVKAAMKPIPTLYKPLQSVDIQTKEVKKANVERSDTTAIVPASIVIESVVAIELAKALTDKFDGDNLQRLQEQLDQYRDELKKF
ncbi:chorismate synthase [Lentilactobacillus buchneri]|uniref:Chorismate synthase n=1 Tax=Lentilactobacillus buchneri DSM 20057 TaxID=1423728 RepID=A0A4V3A4G8_LENBU|nr:chorismate synthase [Lentilactobacillus buchneri]WCJ52628.1 chorismate synthase [Lentilactobacillus sp. Egmn17]AEB72520.1 chorismate synthase [Lentilactobacillus buchneri NRRL B-30929]KRK67396.1 chorismate synthase [Lentilactobacillus buchneri DSM 20057]MCT2881395.1 chorismate synthase [Lentilactobacillus buchneri]MCT2897911.1 chorismate synthase [Lentilactobacillus buchneri]